MNENKDELEAFIEHHRADFDAFEPRPDLWDDIEREMATTVDSTAEESPLRIIKLAPDEPSQPTKSYQKYRLAAVLALMLLASGGYFWKQTNKPAAFTWATTKASPLVAAVGSEAATAAPAYLHALPDAMPATNAPAQRLSQAVARMEGYYAAQIAERETELAQLDSEIHNAPAGWQHELTSLDSTYRQLRVELYRNPEPDVVLEAMNRNLQIRLDILKQQLRTREQIQAYHASSPMLAADSHRMP
ncbi:hypothetical protein [Hymenobacter crusticola]|uniref:Uncharacterized protein n=1 Tax=Hymenobacter crusticola TaxID=1770526 RepID=A0A243WI64_9BACT|nr:hypothetical protein [Hymenobacter crusticola]OUJ75242.1 hypothetical protein BXP70_04260 [Hymenobacter crusticola]